MVVCCSQRPYPWSLRPRCANIYHPRRLAASGKRIPVEYLHIHPPMTTCTLAAVASLYVHSQARADRRTEAQRLPAATTDPQRASCSGRKTQRYLGLRENHILSEGNIVILCGIGSRLTSIAGGTRLTRPTVCVTPSCLPLSHPRPDASTGNCFGCCTFLPTERLPVPSRPWARKLKPTLRLNAGVGVSFSGTCELLLVWRARKSLPCALRLSSTPMQPFLFFCSVCLCV